MIPSPSSIFSLLLLALLHPISAANHRKPPPYRLDSVPDSAAGAADDEAPTRYFEVTKPISVPKTQPLSYPILTDHEFAYTLEKPPVLTTYKPPSNPNNFSKIVLEWNATSKGRQFDRIFGVWIGGAEVFRSCTAEPRRSGIVWTVEKDITRYRALLTAEQTVAVYMGNVVDTTYDAVYRVNLTFHFYPPEDHHHHRHHKYGDSPADFILPISRDLPLNDGLWFKIENSTALVGKSVKIPRNSYRAVLEIYVSFHENDEFWYTNYPNEYTTMNNLTDSPGNGPFREVVVHLDGVTVGAVWPFTVIYTGGVNLFLWRPITGLGSFNLPSYDIEITPFLGKLLDPKSDHRIDFSVTNALNAWFVNANLHLWLDSEGQTRGELLEHEAPPLSSSLVSRFSGLDGAYRINTSRKMLSRGRVESSRGVITTESRQHLWFSSSVELGNVGNRQTLDQTIKFNHKAVAKNASSIVFSTSSRGKFRVSLDSSSVAKENGTKISTNVTLGVDEKRRKVFDFGPLAYDEVKNVQKGLGFYIVQGKNVSGLGTTQQEYRFVGDGSCYYRKVKSSNYTILHDKESSICKSVTK